MTRNGSRLVMTRLWGNFKITKNLRILVNTTYRSQMKVKCIEAIYVVNNNISLWWTV